MLEPVNQTSHVDIVLHLRNNRSLIQRRVQITIMQGEFSLQLLVSVAPTNVWPRVLPCLSAS
jgi:hypothetical protein